MKVLNRKTKKPIKKGFKAELEQLAVKDPEFYEFLQNEEKDIFESDNETEFDEEMLISDEVSIKEDEASIKEDEVSVKSDEASVKCDFNILKILLIFFSFR